jgi:hypothetical protein
MVDRETEEVWGEIYSCMMDDTAIIETLLLVLNGVVGVGKASACASGKLPPNAAAFPSGKGCQLFSSISK